MTPSHARWRIDAIVTSSAPAEITNSEMKNEMVSIMT